MARLAMVSFSSPQDNHVSAGHIIVLKFASFLKKKKIHSIFPSQLRILFPVKTQMQNSSVTLERPEVKEKFRLIQSEKVSRKKNTQAQERWNNELWRLWMFYIPQKEDIHFTGGSRCTSPHWSRAILVGGQRFVIVLAFGNNAARVTLKRFHRWRTSKVPHYKTKLCCLLVCLFFNERPPSKCFLWALHQLDMWIWSNRFWKHSIWHVIK